MRNAEELVLDGNAIAGPLSQILVGDVSIARLTCGGCGRESPLATALLYRTAGDVLRCAACSQVLLRLVVAPGRAYIELTGVRCMEVKSA